MRDKKGLSTVVTTLIIILLVLVAIGIIWVVIRGVIETSSSQIKAKGECIGVELSIEGNPVCNGGAAPLIPDCSLVVKRNPGGGNIKGIVATLTDSNSVSNRTEDMTALKELESKNITMDQPTLVSATVSSASVAALVDDGAGGTFVCDIVTGWP